MKMAFRQHGKQFLFYTFCLAGRPQALSRLEKGEKRPLLSAEGEAVHALMRALHPLDASLTASEYCIMPDHVHFLLIVDCERRAEPFKPLVFAHWWQEAAEAAILAARAAAAVPARDGGLAAPRTPCVAASGAPCAAAPRTPCVAASGAPCAAAPRTPCVAASGAPCAAAPRIPGAVAPGGAAVEAAIQAALPTAVRNRYYGPQGVRGAASPPSLAGLWEDRFWVDLSLSSRQLAAIRAYIRGNPARALWKREHPDAFIRHAGFRHRALDPAERWSSFGCLPLLASPFLFHLRLTRRIPVEEQEAAIAAAVEKARGGWIPVGGFLSPAEKEAERRLRAEPRARYVKFLPHGLAPRFDPSLADSRLLAEGRLLILSPFPETVPVSPISRANCERMNALAADTAARAAIQEPKP